MKDKTGTQKLGLSQQEQQRLARIGDELREGIATLTDIGAAVSIFGSARSKPDAWEYVAAHGLARMLASEGITVVTGGGPGVMEAGNSGAKGQPGASVGLNIELPHEQLANPYLDIDLDVDLDLDLDLDLVWIWIWIWICTWIYVWIWIWDGFWI